MSNEWRFNLVAPKWWIHDRSLTFFRTSKFNFELPSQDNTPSIGGHWYLLREGHPYNCDDQEAPFKVEKNKSIVSWIERMCNR